MSNYLGESSTDQFRKVPFINVLMVSKRKKISPYFIQNDFVLSEDIFEDEWVFVVQCHVSLFSLLLNRL
jgi:hypothetical protein